jgi:L-cysteine S-thiosulfotransferase
MQRFGRVVVAASMASMFFGVAELAPRVFAAEAQSMSVVEQGKEIAFERKKGHCLACHQIAGGQLAGTVGPALVAVKQRYPDKTRLRAQISDARLNNPNTIMPPFGPNNILSEDELNKVVEYVYSL